MVDEINENELDKEIEAKMVAMVNAAVSSHIKRAMNQLTKTIESQLEAKLSEISSKEAPKQEKTEDNELARQLKALTQKLELSERQAKQEAEKREAIEKQSRFNSGKQELRNHLQGKVSSSLLDLAVDHLTHVQNRLSFDESGNTMFKIKKAPYSGAKEEDIELPLQEAITEFMKSKEAQPFLPAPGAGSTIKQEQLVNISESGDSKVANEAMKKLSDLGLLDSLV